MATSQLLYLNQYFTTTLNVGGGIDDTQTTGIIVADVSGVDTSKPGIAILSYSDPLNTTLCEWIEYTSINGSKEFVGVTRGSEGFSAKSHDNGVSVAFPLSESHVNRINEMFNTVGLDIAQIATPASPDSGRNKVYFKSDDNLYKLTSSGTETEVGGGGGAGVTSQALINGSFDVWQRGTTFTFNDDVYGPDRWNLLTETNGAWTCARDTDVPVGIAKYSAKFTNVTLNNQCAIVQFIENVDAMKLDDSTVSLSFYAKTSGTEIANLRAAVLSWSSTADTLTSDVVGTWASDGTDPTWAANWTAENTPSNLTLTSSWTRYSLTATIDTASMANIAVVIWVDDGTVAANDDFWITGVQLCAGSTALTYKPKTYLDELNSCERFTRAIYAGNTSSAISFGSASSTTSCVTVLPLRVEMRITPTLESSTAADWRWNDGAASVVLTSLAVSATVSDKYTATLVGGVAAGLTQYRPYRLEAAGAADKRIVLTAEL